MQRPTLTEREAREIEEKIRFSNLVVLCMKSPVPPYKHPSRRVGESARGIYVR